MDLPHATDIETGRQLVAEIQRLVTERLPRIAANDPARPALVLLADGLNRWLSRARLALVETDPPGRD